LQGRGYLIFVEFACDFASNSFALVLLPPASLLLRALLVLLWSMPLPCLLALAAKIKNS
jgi:hypothetical protein